MRTAPKTRPARKTSDCIGFFDIFVIHDTTPFGLSQSKPALSLTQDPSTGSGRKAISGLS